MLNKIKNLIFQKMDENNQHTNVSFELASVNNALQELKVLEGKKLAVQNMQRVEVILQDLNKAEFKVFSQWGDDGIIQFLIDYLEIETKTFIEFGVENYMESNTRFTLINNCWKGLVMDGSDKNVNEIKKSNLYWQYHLEANCAFITKENINELIANYIKNEDLGLLVIDVDGNDYWIWEAIEHVKPVLVVVEYNSLFGSRKAISIPYKDDFKRTEAHFSNLYYGASLAALKQLAERKGYALVACNNNGNNAFFVRKDRMKNLKEKSVEQAYRKASFRESRNEMNQLTYLNFDVASQVIKGLPVFNITTAEVEML